MLFVAHESNTYCKRVDNLIIRKSPPPLMSYMIKLQEHYFLLFREQTLITNDILPWAEEMKHTCKLVPRLLGA